MSPPPGPPPHPPRSALLAAWGSAWLAGATGLPELVRRVTGGDDHHAVTGLWVHDLPLEQAAGRLRADGVVRMHLVLPVPGDPVGLPGPGAFPAAALEAGEGVLATRADGTGTGLVPSVVRHGTAREGTVTSVRWAALPLDGAPRAAGPQLADAEHELRRGLAECVTVLRGLDVARWRPEHAGALDDLRRRRRTGADAAALPPGWPERAEAVLGLAGQLAGILALAGDDPGGAVTGAEATAREEALRRLGRQVRHALVAAYNAGPAAVSDRG